MADFLGVAAARDDRVLVASHKGEELLSYVLHALHVAELNEILTAPRIGETAGFPSVVDVQESDVVAGCVVELGLLLVGLLLLFAWAMEDVLGGGDHGYDGQYLFGALQLYRFDQGL